MTLTTDGRIFRQHGQPWRWKGVSAFKLLDRFAHGEDIAPFLSAFAGFNVLRVFDYVTWPDGLGWEPSPIDMVIRFIDYCAERGFYTELVLLTDSDPARIQPARDRIAALAAEARRRLT